MAYGNDHLLVECTLKINIRGREVIRLMYNVS